MIKIALDIQIKLLKIKYYLIQSKMCYLVSLIFLTLSKYRLILMSVHHSQLELNLVCKEIIQSTEIM